MTISTKFLRVLPGYGAMALAVSLNLVANDVQALSLTGTSGAFSNPIGGGVVLKL